MSLGELSIACLFGPRTPPAHYEVGLLWRGSELTAGRYKRVRVLRTAWLLAGATATATVRFDGFAAPVKFDAVAVYLPDGAVLQRTALDGEVHLGMPDTAVDLEATVDMTSRPGT